MRYIPADAMSQRQQLSKLSTKKNAEACGRADKTSPSEETELQFPVNGFQLQTHIVKLKKICANTSNLISNSVPQNQ